MQEYNVLPKTRHSALTKKALGSPSIKNPSTDSLAKNSEAYANGSESRALGKGVISGGKGGLLKSGIQLGIAAYSGAPSEALRSLAPGLIGTNVGLGMFRGTLNSALKLASGDLGFSGRYSDAGAFITSALGGLSGIGLVGGMIAKPLGAILGDLVGDTFNAREAEGLRDMLEANSETISFGELVSLTEHDDMAAIDLELEGGGKLGITGAGEKPGYFSKAADYLSDMTSGILGSIEKNVDKDFDPKSLDDGGMLGERGWGAGLKNIDEESLARGIGIGGGGGGGDFGVGSKGLGNAAGTGKGSNPGSVSNIA